LGKSNREILENCLSQLEKKEREILTLKELLESQSKKAMMGGMLDAIAHQWNQPLGVISLYSKMLLNDYEYGDINREYLQHYESKIDLQIDYLTETLQEFRDFFRPTKQRENFSVQSVIKSVLLIMQDTIKGSQITVNIDKEEDFHIFGIKNEFKHVLINILSNAKDIFIERKITKREINVKITKENGYNIIYIRDNGGGIPEYVIDRIFELNFTTKSERGGTGVGLYLTKEIAEKMKGEMGVRNFEDGAEFSICFKAE
jgi:signal transduction histidine kinase